MFDRLGEFRFPLKSVGTGDEVLEKAIDAGADDVVSGEGEGTVHDDLLRGQDSFNVVRDALEEIAGHSPAWPS
jgi:transcriptional/translational regulatory protein YebC/TACO1